MKTLSVRQPWAWLIVTGQKDIENRTWDTSYRGELAVHAGVYRPSEEELVAIEEDYGVTIPRDALRFGGVIGTVHVLDCVENHDSIWFLGPIGWTLARAREIPFVPMKGRLGLFEAEIPDKAQ